ARTCLSKKFWANSRPPNPPSPLKPTPDHAPDRSYPDRVPRQPRAGRGEESACCAEEVAVDHARRGPSKGGLAGPGQRNGTAVRLFSAVAKEGAVFQTRSRRRSPARSRARHGRPGGEPELRRAGAGGIGRGNRSECSRGGLRSQSRPARTDR